MKDSAQPVPIPDRAAPTSTLLDASPLTAAEVGELWEFVHGDIMVGGIRSVLRSSLGPCPRHTWGYAVVEVELWIYGTGSRGGHQPFDVCVLYADLLADVVDLLHRRRASTHPLGRTLQRRGRCWICTQLGPNANRPPTRSSYAGANPTALAAEANQLSYTSQWLQETASVWQSRVCPDCLADFASTTGQPVSPTGGVRCLAHLTRGGTPAVDVPGLADHLAEIRTRVELLGRSMRQGAQAPALEQKASWIEALGWFASWHFPLHLFAEPRTAPQVESQHREDDEQS